MFVSAAIAPIFFSHKHLKMEYHKHLNKKQRRELDQKLSSILPHKSAQYTNNVFYRVYEAMSGYGLCDSAGGDEYQRVLSEWNDEKCPPNLAKFIYKAANRPPLA